MLFPKRVHPFSKKHVCSFKTRKTYENRNEHITRRTTLPHPCLRLAGTRHALLSQLRAPLGQRAAEAVDYAQSRAPLPPPRGWVLPWAADTYAEAGEGGGGRVGCAVRKYYLCCIKRITIWIYPTTAPSGKTKRRLSSSRCWNIPPSATISMQSGRMPMRSLFAATRPNRFLRGNKKYVPSMTNG